MSAEHKPRLIVRFRLSLLRILLHCVKVTWGNRGGQRITRDQIRDAEGDAIRMSSRNDHRRRDRSWERNDRDRDRDRYRDRDRGGDRGRGRGDRYPDSRRRSRSRSPRRGDHERRPGAHGSFWFLGLKLTRNRERQERPSLRR